MNCNIGIIICILGFFTIFAGIPILLILIAAAGDLLNWIDRRYPPKGK